MAPEVGIRRLWAPQDIASAYASGMPPLERLVDACRNRTLEGLRTLEDLARFTREDQPTAAALKQLRHDVAAAVADGWSETRLLEARNTADDVGTSLETQSETSRCSTAEIAGAASGRVAEGLRSLEEAAKMVTGETNIARSLERIRYAVYDVSAKLIGQLQTSSRRQWRVCLLLDREACTHPWREVLDAALSNGVDCVQLREKQCSDARLLEHATAIVEIAHKAGASVIMNDRADMAVASGADGVHLGQQDLSVTAARSVVGSGMLIGVSTHAESEAQASIADGADYVGIGPIFNSGTKPDLEASGVQRIVDTLAVLGELPHLAIGGIDISNIDLVAATGARGVAVGNAICAADDPGKVCAALVAAMDSMAIV